jgi:hypothetical protein
VLKSKSLPLLAGAAALGVIAFATVPASADVIDPLHGQCVGTAPNCVDNGNNTPTSDVSLRLLQAARNKRGRVAVRSGRNLL